MAHTYTPINSAEDRKAPIGKYRVLLNVHGDALYYVDDFDTAEEAFIAAEALGKRGQNGIVQGNSDWILYPWDYGHQLHTREELLQTFGKPRVCEITGEVLEKALTDTHIAAIEEQQASRIPGWKPGHRLVVFWRDIAKATGAGARPGDF